MDQLVADGKLREKVYGKQKVYVVNQVGGLFAYFVIECLYVQQMFVCCLCIHWL